MSAVSKVYKSSRAQTCRLTAFCVNLTYVAILRYRRVADEVAVEICAFVSWIFFVRGMEVILFYNLVYVYVCNIGEKQFGRVVDGVFMVGSIQPALLQSQSQICCV